MAFRPTKARLDAQSASPAMTVVFHFFFILLMTSGIIKILNP